jgi:hypothetical protein
LMVERIWGEPNPSKSSGRALSGQGVTASTTLDTLIGVELRMICGCQWAGRDRPETLGGGMISIFTLPALFRPPLNCADAEEARS